MTQLIGIAGKARAGKDTAAQVLASYMEVYGTRCDILHFADPLKKMAAALSGNSLSLFNDDIAKEQVIPWLGITRRKLMQMLGSEVIKPHFGNDVWVKRIMVEVERLTHTTDFIVVPDVRFDLEAQAIKDKGGLILQINRPQAGLSGDAANHISELGVHPDLVDTTIENDGPMIDFEREVERFAQFSMHVAGLK